MAKPVILRFLGDTTSLDQAFARLKAESSAAQGHLASLSASMTAFGKSARKTGRMMTTKMTLPIALALGVSAKLAVDFEASMKKIEGLVGVSAGQVKRWSEDIMKMSTELPIAPRELADALFFVTSAGFRGSEALDILRQSARASAAGLGETKTVADAITSALNAYGIENLSASTATDILVASVREGKMPAEDLAGALGRVISPAQALGVGFDQVGASIASMTRVGLSADESATALRQVLMGMLKPSKQATEAFAEMGYKGDELRKTIKEKGLLVGLQALRDKAGSNTAALGKLFPNVRALNGFLIMTGKSSKKTAEIFSNLSKSTGSADTAFEVASKTAKFKLHKVMSSLQATAIQIGNIVLPILLKVAGAIAKAAAWFSKLSPAWQKVGVAALAFLAVIGPIVWLVGALASAFGFLLSPIGLVLVAVAAVAIGAVILYKKWKPFRDLIATLKEKFLDFANKTREAFSKALHWIREVIASPALHARVRQFGQAFSDLGNTLRAAWDAIAAIFMFAVWLVKTVLIGPIMDMWERFGGNLMDHLRIAWNAILEVFKGVLQMFKGIFEIFAGIFTLDFGKVWQGIKDLFGGAWDAIIGVAKFAINSVSTVIGIGMASISSLWSAIWDGLGAIVGGAWDAILWALKSGWNLFAGFWNRVLDALMAPAKILGDHVPGMKWLSSLAGVRIPLIVDAATSSGGDRRFQSDGVTRFANGGIIDRPTRALIGEAGVEVVIPLTRPRRAAQLMEQAGLTATGTDSRSSNSGGLVIQTMNIQALDPRRAARIAAQEMAWAAKTGGY